MKKLNFKFLTLAIVAFISADCSAYTLVIRKTKLNGDGSGNYKYVNRDVKDDIVNIEGVPRLQNRTIEIFCEGAGGNTCPNNIAYNGIETGEQPSISDLFTLEAINAAQLKLNYAETQSLSGGSGSESGTIVTSDGMLYEYSMSWSTNSSGIITINMTFEDA